MQKNNLIILIVSCLFIYSCNKANNQLSTSETLIKSLNQSSKIVNNISHDIYSKIEIASFENPAKVKSIKLKKNNVKTKTIEIIDFTQKFNFLNDDVTIIYNKISELKNFYISFCDTLKDKTLVELISNNLNTEKYRDYDKKLLSSIILLDISQAEYFISLYLFGQIDMPTFKLNKIDPVVLLPTNIKKNTRSKADIFLSGRDTSVNCIVNIDNKIYTMSNGKLNYELKTDKSGIVQINAKLILKTFLNEIEIPFVIKYQVNE